MHELPIVFLTGQKADHWPPSEILHIAEALAAIGQELVVGVQASTAA